MGTIAVPTSGSISINFTTSHLSLYGPHSIIGRSIAVRNSSDGMGVSCATIRPNKATLVSAAQALGPLKGWIYFEQVAMLPTATTTVIIDVLLDNATGIQPQNSTSASWFITTVCANSTASQLPIYDPFDAAGGSLCGSDSYLCAVGDLSGKHGNISLTAGMQVVTDVQLPLSGSFGITGLYVLINIPGMVSSCLPIQSLPPRTAGVDGLLVNEIVGPLTNLSSAPSSNILIFQATPWDAPVVSVDQTLQNSSSLVLGSLPILTALSGYGENVCDLVGNVFGESMQSCSGNCHSWDQFTVCMFINAYEM